MQKEQVLQTLLQYCNQLMQQSTPKAPAWNIEKVLSGKPNDWNYIDACMITAILSLYEITGEEHYLTFADNFVGWFVQPDGSIKNYAKDDYNIDNIRPGKNLFALYALTGKEKYRHAMDTIYSQLETMPRTEGGNFWHKKIYPWQVWLDGLYMAQPFYMEYETKLNGLHHCLDSFRQFTNVRQLMRDTATGLYYHGYDESRSMNWANPETGCSPNFWLRALGWFFLSLVDTLEVMDEQMYYEYRTLQAMLKEFADAILPWQQPDGMFYQLINLPQQQGNYLETSGTMLLSCALLKAVRLGFLPAKYKAFGEKAFYGTANRYLTLSPDGKLSLGGICLVAGLGGKEQRDGSVDYYLSEPVVVNEAKGVAPMLLAATELLRG